MPWYAQKLINVLRDKLYVKGNTTIPPTINIKIIFSCFVFPCEKDKNIYTMSELMPTIIQIGTNIWISIVSKYLKTYAIRKTYTNIPYSIIPLYCCNSEYFLLTSSIKFYQPPSPKSSSVICHSSSS